MKTASKAKFFIEFYSSCLEGIVSHQNHILLKTLCNTEVEIIFLPPSQRHAARVRMTHRAVMFPGFSNKPGPSNNCQRSEDQSVHLEMFENTICCFSQAVNLRFVHLS